jgi:hypothetical protein
LDSPDIFPSRSTILNTQSPNNIEIWSYLLDFPTHLRKWEFVQYICNKYANEAYANDYICINVLLSCRTIYSHPFELLFACLWLWNPILWMFLAYHIDFFLIHGYYKIRGRGYILLLYNCIKSVIALIHILF